MLGARRTTDEERSLEKLSSLHATYAVRKPLRSGGTAITPCVIGIDGLLACLLPHAPSAGTSKGNSRLFSHSQCGVRWGHRWDNATVRWYFGQETSKFLRTG
jgi:hypothetical protein